MDAVPLIRRQRQQPINLLVDLDQQFMGYLEMAKSMMSQLRRARDQEICGKYVRKCCAMSAPIQLVKENRNSFFRYFLAMLRTAAANQPYDCHELTTTTDDAEERHQPSKGVGVFFFLNWLVTFFFVYTYVCRCSNLLSRLLNTISGIMIVAHMWQRKLFQALGHSSIWPHRIDLN